MDMKNLRISGAIGAAPDNALSTFNKPNFFLRALKPSSCATKLVILAIKSFSPISSLLLAVIFPNFEASAKVLALVLTRLSS